MLENIETWMLTSQNQNLQNPDCLDYSFAVHFVPKMKSQYWGHNHFQIHTFDLP